VGAAPRCPTLVSWGWSSTVWPPGIGEPRPPPPFPPGVRASPPAVRGPPFLYLFPLADATTTGETLFGVITVGAWPKAFGAADANTPAAVPAFTNARRLIFSAMVLLARMVERPVVSHRRGVRGEGGR